MKPVETFHQLVDGIIDKNAGHPLLWYNWLTCRDRLNPGLWQDVTNQDDSAPDGPSLYPFHKALFTIIFRAVRFILWWALSPRVGRTCEQPDLILSSLWDIKAMMSEPGYRDTYFGDLARCGRETGLSVLHVGIILGNTREILTKFRARSHKTDPDMISLGSYVRPYDIPGAVFRAAFPGFRKGSCQGWAKYIQRDLLADSGTRFDGIMLEKAWKRLLADKHPKRCLQMWENNPWEKALLIAAKPINIPCDGYLHTVVIPAHLKYHLTNTSLLHQPLPRHIFCAGDGSAARLANLGPWPADKIKAACALRDTLPDLPPVSVSTPYKIKTVLVVLEGLPTMVNLVLFADDIAKSFPDLNILVRPHPVLGLDKLGPMAGVEFNKGGAHKAPDQPITKAIAGADLVIYQGSMVAMTAFWMGVPVAKFIGDPVLDDDPISARGLYPIVTSTADLNSAFAHYETKDQSALLVWQKQAKGRVAALMSPQTRQRKIAMLTPQTHP